MIPCDGDWATFPVVLRALVIAASLGYLGFYGWIWTLMIRGAIGWRKSVAHSRTMEVDQYNPDWTKSRPGARYAYHNIQIGHERFEFFFGLVGSVVFGLLTTILLNVSYCAL